MHNLKEIRKDFLKFEKDLEKRSVKIDFNKHKENITKILNDIRK